ncbi:nucleoside-diphosphate-sugar epimerase [Nocardia tenerifensis]|uniref:Nucleoside-diphosphate-sugar epimerase n=1 Tax=Nocardia tenerifensis TaxID=228006 RepID=A0A318K5J8_9NOCA|nr:NAD-dependent epimerase/dehydratase family protein [Nocardia tenerifensis]PXX63943.1 nucleoside-diphosphate-sugar epimerase [Nocardia tenerifensis]
MRVVVLGATGNVGTAVVESLAADPAVTSILGVARRLPNRHVAKTEWASADVRTDDLAALFQGADAVVHLAWLIQPTHRPDVTWAANAIGSARVLDAVAAAGVPALAYASSVGAYSPRRDDRPVTESWPTDGWPEAGYMREKAYVERLLDTFEQRYPACRVVRLRPGFIFQRGAASGQRRLFAGPLLPNRLVRPELLPVLPLVRELLFQVVHADDVADAFRLAVTRPVSGPFNIAAEPLLDPARLGELFDARPARLPTKLVRTALAAAWHLRLIPVPPQLFDGFLRIPVLDTTRAHIDLGWQPRFSSLDALRELVDGLRTYAAIDTPPLARHAGGPLRIHEFTSGVGGADPVDLATSRRS